MYGEKCEALKGNESLENTCNCNPTLAAEDINHSKACKLYTAPTMNKEVEALIAMVDALPDADAITEENREQTKMSFEGVQAAYKQLISENKEIFEKTKQYEKLKALPKALDNSNIMDQKPEIFTGFPARDELPSQAELAKIME